MLTPQDAIYYIEQRFNCKRGYPAKSIDQEGLHKYVTLVARGKDGTRGAMLINALSDIADHMKWMVTGRPVLHWRYTTKVDDYPFRGMTVTRVYIEQCDDYGRLRDDDWLPPFPYLKYTRPGQLLIELSPEAKAVVFPVLTPGPEVA